MLNSKIIVFEPNMNSYPHSEINAGIISLIELVHKDKTLVFKADKKHYNAVQEIGELNNWEYEPTRILSYEPKFFLINDFILIYKITRLLLSLKKTDKLYLLGIMPLAHIFLSFLNSILKKQCLVCLHGQMEAYLDYTKIGMSKYYYRLSKSIFKRNDTIDYLIFGESIKNNLLFLFNSKKKLIVIDQPYIYKELNAKVITLDKTIYTFGILGRFDQSKNINEFFYFIDLLSHEILENKLVIKIIGKVNCEIPAKYRNLISFYDRSLTKKEFEKDVSQLDYVISFTNESYYRATPSGVFFDCIKWEIPILSLNNLFINYYFTKYDKVGEIFTNTSEMVGFIKENIINSVTHSNNYFQYILNLRKLKHFLSVEKLSEQFVKQI